MTAVRRLLPVAVAAGTFLAFLPALGGGFLNWDDSVNIVANEAYRGLGWPQLRWMFTTTLLAVYSPLAWLTLAVNYVLGGMNPRGYHLGNVLLHAANAGLFYLLARRLLASAFEGALTAPSPPAGVAGGVTGLGLTAGAAAAALVFGVHPLRVESVAWVTERRDVLCGSFYLLAALAYVRGAQDGGPVRGRWRAASLAAFAAALLSKGIAMTLPLSLLVLDAYPLRRRGLGWRALVREKLPYALLATLGAVAALVATGAGAAWTGYDAYGPAARLAMVGFSFWFYPWKLLWPHGLSPLYELPQRVALWDPQFLAPAVAVVVVTAALVALRRHLPGGLSAWCHSAIVVAPVSGLVHAGHQLAHDRWSYLSGLGFALLAGGGIAWVVDEWKRQHVRGWLVTLVAAGATLTVVGLGMGTWRQCQAWRSSETLWRAAIDVDPTCAICHNNLGAAIVRSDGFDAKRAVEAEAHFRHAIQLRPERLDPYVNLGALLALERRYPEAEQVFATVRRQWPQLAEGPTRLAMVYADQGRHAEAIELLRPVRRVTPDFALARAELARSLHSLGVERLRAGRLSAAAEAFREAAGLQPNRPEPLRNLGQVLVEEGKAREALGPLERAVALGPRDAPARFWLARAYLLVGDRAKADAEVAVLRELDAVLAGQVTPGRRGDRHERH